MPHAGHRVIFGLAAILLPALLVAASPAAAAQARSQLSVGARVLPACEATADGGASAASTCGTGAQGTISVEQGRSARYPEPPAIGRADMSRVSDSTLTWVTITY